MKSPSPSLARTPSGARLTSFGVHCFERKFEGEDARPPVKLVVFDCDETLTISTFMPKERDFEKTIGWSSWPDYISMVNFGTPFIEENRDFEEPFGASSRLTRLRELFQALTRGEEGQARTLAVLTRNSRGAVACLNLLMMARLAEYFSVIWSMSTHQSMANGVYREGTTWKMFRAPLSTVNDHKADVLASVARAPAKWFPQLAAAGGSAGGGYTHLQDLTLEGIVLVDDVRTNFQSPSESEAKVLRYCKVARYDAKHPQMGFLADMGGIGAKRTEDYDTLMSFVQEPWKFKAEPRVMCVERHFAGCQECPEVSLVVFEFDGTLSLCTFIPDEDPAFAKVIGHVGGDAEVSQCFVEYNFESPYMEGSRVAQLRELLQGIGISETGGLRSLAILTENQAGAVAVLNLLLMADLADCFCAIWAPMAADGLPRCACRRGAAWEEFDPPAEGMHGQESKGDLLASIVARPCEWFPQAFSDAGEVQGGAEHLAPGNLRLENIVLIDDDERTKFHTSSGDSLQVLRYCKVARYDDFYRDQGLMMHMGGIGARSEKDYKLLRYFVDRPWKSRVSEDPEPPQLHHPEDLLEHSKPEAELPKVPSFHRRSDVLRAKTAPAGQLTAERGEFQWSPSSATELIGTASQRAD